MAIYLTKVFDMVNHTKLISTLTLFPLSNNTKRWLSAYVKRRSASGQYNFTLSPSFHAKSGVLQDARIFSTLHNFVASKFP